MWITCRDLPNDLVYLDAGDDFYDGKQGEAYAGDDTIHGEDEMTQSVIVGE